MPRIVKPEGSPESKIAFVGEAPGGQEERLGRPFVGPSGQLLDECLQSVGISRKDCYLTNVVKERPPNNDISSFIDISKSKPKITEAGQAYLDSFLAEVKELKANVIVPLGNVPLWALTGGLKLVTKRHGSILGAIDGRKIIPTIHPAAALREYLFKYYIQHDLRRIRREAEFPEIKLTEYKLLIKPTFEEAMKFLDDIMIPVLKDHIKIVIDGPDLEVLNGEISCVSIGYEGNTISIPFTDEHGDYFSPEQEVLVWRMLAELLECSYILKTGQNLSFDATFLHNKYGIVVSPMFDT
ncbi:MAG: uracil-DNA glycosylase family protein, partial [Patescibacteria group bacterium]